MIASPFVCVKCGRPPRQVYGSMEWHARNDPPGGYCHCEVLSVITDAIARAAVPSPDAKETE